MANTPQSMSSLSRKSSPGDDGQEAVGTIWSSETQGPLMHVSHYLLAGYRV